MNRDHFRILGANACVGLLTLLAASPIASAANTAATVPAEPAAALDPRHPEFVGPVMASEVRAPEPVAAVVAAAVAATSEPVSLVMGGSLMIKTPGRVGTVVVAHPAVADARPVSPNEIIVLGKAVGQTDLVLRLEDGSSITRRVTVGLDREELQSRLKRIFGVDLQADDVGGAIALRGDVPDLGTGALIKNYMDAGGAKWVDLTRFAGLRQVQLKVRIAEASRQALRELAFGAVVGGSSFFGGLQAPGTGSPFQRVSISPGAGAQVTNTLAGGATTAASSVTDPNFGFNSLPVSSATTLFGGVPGADLEFYIQALVQNSYVRLLAEPNLVAISGQQATFLVGGEFPIPVVQGMAGGAGNSVTVEYKEYGVRLNFRPEVLGDGRIRLEVAPEVSELSTIGSIKQAGFEVPSVIVRRSKTTVELGSGQSFAMAGLLRTKDQARVAKVPVLGDIPVFGALFRSVRYEQDQTELVVMVTADLVEPLDDGMDRPMPGDLHQTPNDWELFMEGRISGTTELGTLNRLKALGLTGLRGPGAWRRSDEPRRPAADPMPTAAVEEAAAQAQPMDTAETTTENASP
ncbi:MAG: type II and III secretion system protein family protein [Planctomycetes bacterium]|nr:type II and III secretion system protein family protein [Planctomycetota bacterium]